MIQLPGRFAANQHPEYLVLDILSQGGMGLILRAQSRTLGHEVALKLILNHSASHTEFERFEREAKVTAQLQHPHIVRMFAYDQEAGTPFFVLELIQGRDLEQLISEFLKTHGELPSVDYIVQIFEKVCDALQYIHARGLVHRDIKPANIIIEDKTERPVLVDFGVVKSLNKVAGELSLTASQHVVGTPDYMSPEQADPGGDFGGITTATDIWAIGATLYTCLTGEKPFRGQTQFQLLKQILTDDIPVVQDSHAECPRWLSDTVAACMQRQPEHRPSSGDLVEALEQGEALVSQQQSHSRKLWPVLAMVALVILVGVSALLLGQKPKLIEFSTPAFVNSEKATIQGRFNQAHVTFHCGDSPVTSDAEGRFQIDLTLSQGLNKLVLESQEAGIRREFEIIRDQLAPVIRVLPYNERVYVIDGDDKRVITVRVDDSLPVSVTVNGREQRLEGSTLKLTLQLKDEVEVYEIKATDKLNQSSQLKFAVIDQAYFRGTPAILEDLEAWADSTSGQKQAAFQWALARVGRDFEWLGAETYSCQKSYTIGRYRSKALGAVFHLIPGGTFKMGTDLAKLQAEILKCTELGYNVNYLKRRKGDPGLRRECPQVAVTIRRPFLLAETELSIRQWQRVLGETSKNDRPKTSLTFGDINDWLAKLDNRFRLPTETEWEYACRAGTQTRFYWGDRVDERHFWSKINSGGRLHDVDSHKDFTNAFGLKDMSGNAWEWCLDKYVPSYNASPSKTELEREVRVKTRQRATRGGSALWSAASARCAHRGRFVEHRPETDIGLRLAYSIPKARAR